MKHPEDHLQAQCVQWFRLQYPNYIIYAIPNGGKRHILEAIRLKRTGVLAGVPDLCIPIPSKGMHGLYIEMKVGRNKPTKDQLVMIGLLAAYGYRTAICYTFEEFRNAVKEYLD